MDIISNMVEVHLFRRIDKNLEFLLLKRSLGEFYEHLWQMVSGRIEEDEKAYKTALREVKEETGLTVKKIWSLPNINSFYSPETDMINLIPVFAVQVDPYSKVILSDEHSEYKWVAKEECKKLLAWEGQRKSVDILFDYFNNYKEYLDLVEIKLH
ncbi:MAG: NUDIX pyrophosphatase [Flavobacterium sp.]|nr:NUDIX pyrophosphatase [Flavobacterium sp.]